jgi:ABC-type branched-subunit amino acid transport system ATPase component
VGVIGPNGAGKTTVFDLVSGFLTADAGRIALGGRDMTELSPERRARLGLARSFQDARLFGGLTVHQAIAVALDGHGSSWRGRERRLRNEVDDLVELMGLTAYRDKFLSELSTGSRRIVDLACQIGIGPQVILFDEPSSGIAQRETEALGPLLLRVREQTGASLLVIEHDMPLITAVSDRMVALALGRVIAEGDPAAVVVHPEVVASYLGSSTATIHRSGKVHEPAG